MSDAEYGPYASQSDAEEAFEEFLDDIYGKVTICGYEYSSAIALKFVDCISYDEEFNNWLASV